MFKVMCICDDQHISRKGANDSARVVFGEVYTVVDSYKDLGLLLYNLQEIDWASFDANLFSPVSDIDETELVNAKPELATA